jgi:aspartate ammonia-lyase
MDGKNNARVEHDLLGEMTIASNDLRGIHTLRAAQNFTVSGRAVHPKLIHAYALVKKSCALANLAVGRLDEQRTQAIASACDEVSEGTLDRYFTLDALQGGAGTSTNMNLNEVIANRANQLLAASVEPGTLSPDAYSVHPLDHVNLHQSTNDTYPTALKVCVTGMLRETADAAASLQGALQKKEREFADIVTVGRTELQSAVPMTLGAIFSGFAESAGRDRWRTFKCEERVRTVNLGGTAVGSGLAAPRAYIFRVTDILRELTGYPLARAENLVDQTANIDSLVEVAGILSSFAANLIKTSRDLRFLAHEGEIALPAFQAGSSIMPGKVNPVICEAVIQAGMRARSSCALVGEAASHGTLQINEYLPLVADALTEALDLIASSCRMLSLLVEGITANAERCRALVDSNPIIVTAFLPYIGYESAQELLAEYGAGQGEKGVSIREFLGQRLGIELVDRVLSPEALSALGFPDSVGVREQPARQSPKGDDK